MKGIKRLLGLLLTLAMIVSICPVVNAAVNMEGKASANYGMSAIPAPESGVIIDGDFSEWDWSGRIEVFNNYDYKDIYGAEVAAMYDSENLYLAFDIIDPSPLHNSYNPETEAKWTWRGDAIQLRLIGDTFPVWVTCAYYDRDKVGSLYLSYFDSPTTWDAQIIAYLTEPGGTKLTRTVSMENDPKICLDGEICYKEHEDGLGYNIEIKMPFKIFNNANSKNAGEIFQMGIETYWGDLTGAANYEYSAFDNFQPGKYTAGFFYRATTVWGNVTLEKSGNLTPREYIPDPENTINGTINIPVKVPKEAERLTLVLEDKYGNRVANAVNELEVKNNIIEEGSDYYIVNATWDGTKLLGDMADPGEYTVKGIYHEGIEPYFDTAAYNPGTPKWTNSDGTGSWGSDHMAPTGVAAGGNGCIYIGWPYAESGRGIVCLGEDGTTKWNHRRGAEIIAADDNYVYALPGSDVYANTTDTGNAYLMRLDLETGDFATFNLNGEERDLQLYMSEILGISRGIMPKATGLAANGKVIALATKKNNADIPGGTYLDYGDAVNILNYDSAILEKRISVPDVGQIAFSKTGELYAVSGNSIVEVDVNSGKVTTLPITFEEGCEIGAFTVDNYGNMVIFDKGEDLNLKVYSKNGNFLYSAAKEGGRALVGDWEEQGLTHTVCSITVDKDDNIWVVEHWNAPRRISVWGRDGKLVKDYIGPTGYMGAGGAQHDTDPEKLYVGSVELEIDRENYTDKVKRILYIPDYSKGQSFILNPQSDSLIQHFRTTINGEEKEFIYKASAAADNPTVLYRELEDGTFLPFWATGQVQTIYSLESIHDTFSAYAIVPEDKTIKECFPGINTLPEETQFIWNDYDYDGAIEYNECEFYNYMYTTYSTEQINAVITNSGWGNRITSDMRFVLTGTTGNNYGTMSAYVVTPDYFTEDGLPRYTKSSFKEVEAEHSFFNNENILIEGMDAILSSREVGGMSKTTYFNGVKLVDINTGKDLWWYHSPYPGVHGSHSAPVGKGNGLLIGPIKVLGIVDVGDEKFFAMRGNIGEDYFFTIDGYYVQTVFQDGRIPQVKLPDTFEEAKGMNMSQMTENGEPFSGAMTVHSDGKVRLLSSRGGTCLLSVEIRGLDTVKRLEPFKITVTQADIDEAEIFNKTDPTANVDESDKTESSGYTIKKLGEDGVTVDGNDMEWSSVESLSISKDGAPENGTAKLAYDNENLYAAFSIVDATPMINGGKEFERLFKTGDVCDIQLSPTGNTKSEAVLGDMRIVLSEMEGKPVAVLIKEKHTDKDNQHFYSPGIGPRYFDHVSIIEDAEVSIARDESGVYVLEAKIPFSALGFTPSAGQLVSGDVGIVTSDEFGTYNVARIYHYNDDTGLVNDIPHEATLYPNKWGRITFGE